VEIQTPSSRADRFLGGQSLRRQNAKRWVDPLPTNANLADLFLYIEKNNKATLKMGHQRGWVCLLTQSLSKHPHPY
jgi:hypothetical protein